MAMILDEDLMRVAEFMQQNVPAARLVSVSDGLAGIAPLLWGHFPSERIAALRLVAPSITTSAAERTQASST